MQIFDKLLGGFKATRSGAKSDTSKFFMLMGSPRSGTTLLVRTLNLADGLILPGESDFIVPLAMFIEKVQDEQIGKDIIKKYLVNQKKYARTLGVYLTPEEVAEVVDESKYDSAAIVGGLFGKIAEKTNNKMAGDKSPNDLQYAHSLGSFFDRKVKILHLVRDIRPVVMSLIKAGWIKGIEEYFPRIWTESNLYLHSQLRGKSFYHMLKYEDLVTGPEKELKAITGFLGVEFSKDLLDHTKREGFDDPNHVNLTKPFLKSKATDWRDKIDPKLKKTIDKQAIEAIEAFGYEL